MQVYTLPEQTKIKECVITREAVLARSLPADRSDDPVRSNNPIAALVGYPGELSAWQVSGWTSSSSGHTGKAAVAEIPSRRPGTRHH